MRKLFVVGFCALTSLSFVACSSQQTAEVGTINSDQRVIEHTPAPSASSSASSSESSAPLTSGAPSASSSAPFESKPLSEMSEEENLVYRHFVDVVVKDFETAMVENRVNSDIIQKYFKGDTRITPVLSFMSVGAQITSVQAEGDEFYLVVSSPEGEELMYAKGFWDPDAQTFTLSHKVSETTAAQQFRQDTAAEFMSKWPTSGGS